MFPKYLIGSFLFGTMAALVTLLTGSAEAAMGGAIVIASQMIFLSTLLVPSKAPDLIRQILGVKRDADYIADPDSLRVHGPLGRPELRCLVVDDDPIFLGIMRETLAQLGYRKITVCESAADVLKKISSAASPFDCCFLDVEMPVMDGVVLCQAIRKHPDYAMTPIVMVTAHDGREHVRSAFQSGANDYITKPFDAVELASRLSAIEVATQNLRDTSADARLVPLVSLENYLMQLERGGVFSATLMTFKLNGRQELMSDESLRDPGTVLRKASSCLLSALQDNDGLLAYAGEGVFAAVLIGRKNDPAQIAEIIAREETAMRDLLHPHFYRSISVGKPIVIQNSQEDGNSVFQLHSAIQTAEEDEQIFVA